jgi:hypothetical protein
VKRLICILFIVGISLIGGSYLAAILLLDRLTEGFLVHLETHLALKGVSLKEISVGESALTSFNSARWEDVDGFLGLTLGTTGGGQFRKFRFRINELSCEIGDPLLRRIVVQANEIQLESLSYSSDGSGLKDDFQESLSEGGLRVEIDFNPLHPKESIQEALNSLSDLLKNGRSEISVNVYGTVSFMVGDSRQTAHVLSTALGRQTVIFLDRKDVEHISESYSQRLTETEIDLVATRPLQAPTLLRIKEYAHRMASEAYRRDRQFPKDAYRHVLWSFLLTNEFGPEFAEVVTDAHEVDATYESSVLASKIDYHNNAVGRRYAASGIAEEELSTLVQTDPLVMKRKL